MSRAKRFLEEIKNHKLRLELVKHESCGTQKVLIRTGANIDPEAVDSIREKLESNLFGPKVQLGRFVVHNDMVEVEIISSELNEALQKQANMVFEAVKKSITEDDVINEDDTESENVKS